MTLRCVICGRSLLKAAAWKPAAEGATPHPAGPVGPTCAVKAGLIERTLFSQRRVVINRVRRAKPVSPQMALELVTC